MLENRLLILTRDNIDLYKKYKSIYQIDLGDFMDTQEKCQKIQSADFVLFKDIVDNTEYFLVLKERSTVLKIIETKIDFLVSIEAGKSIYLLDKNCKIKSKTIAVVLDISDDIYNISFGYPYKEIQIYKKFCTEKYVL